ncbi:hypothetical protein PROFUN_09203 [Planoprotostelium fungivorum]|uniref:Uncharacterized protein n=1 Tax=Planoprotostelium fungivorum TaxID=1890364 RepID=A0A2P6N8N7_9EUKA|nr:hypothetical protein PROFUN_12070 [Planoprotostelium fungivorum]PRP83430.1 hypothetical protein PROFUN_09203 [Planoprotostelium fungivorum]
MVMGGDLPRTGAEMTETYLTVKKVTFSGPLRGYLLLILSFSGTRWGRELRKISSKEQGKAVYWSFEVCNVFRGDPSDDDRETQCLEIDACEEVRGFRSGSCLSTWMKTVYTYEYVRVY